MPTVIRYTSAPDAYDGFGTTGEPAPYTDNSRPVRRVRIEEQHLKWQESRYASGCHACITQEDLDRFVRAGVYKATESPAR